MLVSLDLDYNVIGVEGAQSIADAVRNNGALKSLSLNENAMGTWGCAMMAQAAMPSPSTHGARGQSKAGEAACNFKTPSGSKAV